MHPGYLILGDPFPDGPHFEIVNSQRAWHYATEAGITWLKDCSVCPAIDSVVEGTPYTTPAGDHAPWYDPNNPDTEGFFGVIGIDIIGAESSTRSATVVSATTGGGVIGPSYFGPRTMVVRGLAVAEDACSLAAGIDWLNLQYGQTVEECGGDALTYFDCCPCLCLNEQGDPVCWPTNYGGLRDGPSCTHDWWPANYQQLLDGPPLNSETWCSWPRIYRQVLEGPPAWACCVETCVAPYYRQLRKARIVSGPTLIEQREMASCGAMALFEFTIAAADPTEYMPLERSLLITSLGDGDEFTTPDPSMMRAATPLMSRPTRVLERTSPLAGTTWRREQTIYEDMAKTRLSDDTAFHIRLQAPDAAAEAIRVGLWSGENLVGGFWLPYLPAGTTITVDAVARSISALHANGVTEQLHGVVRGYDGVSPVRWDRTPAGKVMLTVDRTPDDTAPVVVEVMVASVGV